MKQHTKWFAAVLAVASGLAVANSGQAQTTVLSDFNNFTLAATYGNWDADGWMTFNGGAGIMAPVLMSTASAGFEVNAGGYGSGAFNFASPISAPGATQFQLTFTLNTPTPPVWMNPQLTISDGTHQVNMQYTGGPFLNYGNYGGPQTYVLTGPLTDAFGGLPLDVSTITAFNIGFDPAGNIAGNIYDITYNSLAVVAVPEPTTLALIGIGTAALVIIRRRNS